VLQRRPSNAIDVWDDGRYLRVLTLSERLVLVEVKDCGSIDDPDIRCTIRSGDDSFATRLDASGTLRKMLGLDIDPAPLQRLAEHDFRDTARALRGMRPPRFADLFEAFARVVPFQQLSLDAGVAIVGRLVAKFGQYVEHEGRRFHAFPTAQTISGARLARLQACGLSARKAQTLRDLARAVESGAVTERQLLQLSTQDALGRLTELPGIGPWSAALVLLRGLGRIDIFPPGDVGAMRGLRVLMDRGPQAPLDRLIERFGAHRGYLYFCALGSSLLSKGLIHAAAD
jgi:DNA-3-methyladenine glycosylase II